MWLIWTRYRDSSQADLAQEERSQATARHIALLDRHTQLEQTQKGVTSQNDALIGLMSSFQEWVLPSMILGCSGVICLLFLRSLTSQQRAMSEILQFHHKESEEQLKQMIRAIPEQVRFTVEIPPQVCLQRPVTFTDAFGRVAPLHLDFINSAEVSSSWFWEHLIAQSLTYTQALIAVLKVRFKHAGLSKVERKEFALLEASSSRTLDLNKPWETVIFPGQCVNMSMIFRTILVQSSCPGCKTDNETALKGDTT